MKVFEGYFDNIENHKKEIQNTEGVVEHKLWFQTNNTDGKWGLFQYVPKILHKYGFGILNEDNEPKIYKHNRGVEMTYSTFDFYKQSNRGFFSIEYKITFPETSNLNYQWFCSFITILSKAIESCSSLQDMKIDNTFIYRKDNFREPNNDGMPSSEYAFNKIFLNVSNGDNYEYNEHSFKEELTYNGPVQISASSKKRTNEIIMGDYLYATENGELTLDKKSRGSSTTNIPIGICVNAAREENGVPYYTFMGMDCIQRTINRADWKYGQWDAENGMEQPYGMGSERDGATNTSNYLKRASEMPSNGRYDDMRGIIRNSFHDGHMPLANGIYRHHTLGTKKGDWYIPAIEELRWAINDERSINKKLSAYRHKTINNRVLSYGSSTLNGRGFVYILYSYSSQASDPTSSHGYRIIPYIRVIETE